MTVRPWIRRVLLSSAVLGAVALAAVGLARWSYADLLHGPRLEPTAAALSLKREFPPPPGWTEAAVAPVLAYADSLASNAIIVIHDGHVIAEWGETDRRTSVHSVRKSLVSALYGIAEDRGLLRLDATLASLSVQEVGRPLTDMERSATLRDLLTARSGIYHASVTDDNGPYPTPGTHRPGEAFVYNNWSFNAAGALFEQVTGLTLGAAFRDWIAASLGMQDFRAEDVRYTPGGESVFPAYRFWMSARDLARFGVLYLNGGRWGDRQVVPARWIAESFTPYSDLGDGLGYGYMWWIMPDSSYMATGTGGQKIRLYPHERLVIVNRVNTGEGLGRLLWWTWGRSVNNTDIAGLRRRLHTALPQEFTGGAGAQEAGAP